MSEKGFENFEIMEYMFREMLEKLDNQTDDSLVTMLEILSMVVFTTAKRQVSVTNNMKDIIARLNNLEGK